MMGFGAALQAEFPLDPGWVTVNHGSYGATPRRVLAAQAAWRARLEAQPTRFMTLEYEPAMAAAGAALAGFLGADAAGLAFLENATTGCNAVLRSLALAPGEEVVLLGHAYGAVRKAAGVVAAAAGARLVEAALPFPRPSAAAVLAGLAAALTPRTRLAVLDHITSPSALVLPLGEMVALCRARGVSVLVDGAHAPGQVALALPALGADWYVGNCHKWLFAPKGCAFLWTAPERRAGTHPLVVSHGLGQGYQAEFGWTGTRDPTAFLSVEAAIGFHAALPRLMDRNHALAAAAGAMLAARWGTEAGARPEMQGSMAVVRLPVAAEGPAAALALRRRLLAARLDAPVFALAGGLWLRLSAAAYNEAADYVRLAERVEAVLAAEA
ncbi:aminotransferase class V-fold PLP-dependent enzyme [Siccirubricoccus phaeus]|uniref:aminotransferase class V-fold PLP-dependent enzyme n=1 Tax=Siccirubricoccus phaeus TaxID=2595053 RepID=UPI0011F3AFBA|nr:aminotransferase class V-fold PLP-dependent enzyme [Siccirubricoccus phaeus]